jgi:hypothetical protein
MMRRMALAASAGALALGGLAVAGGGIATAAVPTITSATSATISCRISGRAAVKPALKNNWDQQAHEAADGEGNPAVRALPDTTFSYGAPLRLSSRAKSISCTGSATDGTNVATVTSVKILLSRATAPVDNPPLAEVGTCTGLLAAPQPEDVAATYTSVVKFKTAGAKLAPTTINQGVLAPAGLGFGITGGVVTGSLAGGNGATLIYIDGDTYNALNAAPATSANPVPTSTKCEASLKLAPGAATLKKPTGLKKITISNNLAPPNDPSTLCLRKGSDCP